jgi:hypothetical protein
MITLNVGISKKIGLPNYSSIGADCHIALELPADLIDHPDQLRPRIQTAYAIVAQAVADELARQAGDRAVTAEAEAPPTAPPATAPTNGHPVESPKTAATKARRERQRAPAPPPPPAPAPPASPATPRPKPTPDREPDSAWEERTAKWPLGHSSGRSQPATEKQIRCLYARAKAMRIDVGELLASKGIHQESDLTIRACSDLIDELSAQAARN